MNEFRLLVVGCWLLGDRRRLLDADCLASLSITLIIEVLGLGCIGLDSMCRE